MNMFYRPPASCQIPNLSGKWEALFGQRKSGCFVEIGAYDGESFSNTSCLADVGWAGIYVEPVPEFAERCRQRHAGNPAIKIVESAVSDIAGEADLHIGDTLISLSEAQVADYNQIGWAKGLHQGRSQKVKTRRLDSILEDACITPGPATCEIIFVMTLWLSADACFPQKTGEAPFITRKFMSGRHGGDVTCNHYSHRLTFHVNRAFDT